MSQLPLVILASRNAKKAAEIQTQLADTGIQIRCMAEFPNAPEVVEDGDSFAANAAKKASQTAKALGHWAIGEDSGICVDALDGAPGIYSARFSGEDATDEKNNALLQEKLSNVPDKKRGAHYVCHVALADPSGEIRATAERTCNGRIIRNARGENGFGYDPYFLIPEYDRTFGELPGVVKKSISHRARAFQQFLPQLVAILKSAGAAGE
ncbi:RdgB/HAM1 family non-canonical purine NTP pyrophosphatase [Rubinisphaera sp. JC750]|uniref:RdgB/HAM1 family non-canonical purine NTP pyrophosphatase n=1 Tax=Rubinisphaera sp. JC750 TaxID=2898658 RepID=UPI001F00654E|nr:RdgB/HAM1 family non-canonical purine NTP pyrophosphatase [Rubinisphaera sp. JC750]